MTHQPPGGFANHSANSITARIDDRILRYSDNRILERLEAYHTDRIDIHLLNLRKIFANAWWMQAFTEDAVIASAATRSMPPLVRDDGLLRRLRLLAAMMARMGLETISREGEVGDLSV